MNKFKRKLIYDLLLIRIGEKCPSINMIQLIDISYCTSTTN